MECLWIVIVIFFYDKVKAETNPCLTYQNVSDTDLQNDFANKMCFPNSPVPTWFRFTSNAAGTMHTDCKSASTCGGSGQVWIDGTLPTYNDGTTHVAICIKMDSCCIQRNMIAVRNCNTFFVFELRRLANCDIRYCFNKNDVPLVTVLITTSTLSSTESTSTSYTTAMKSTISPAFAPSTSYKTTRKSTTSISTKMFTVSTPVTISKPNSSLTTSTFITSLTTTSTKAPISSRLSSSIRPTTIPSMTINIQVTTLVIAICASIGTLNLVTVIFIVLFRVYRSKLQQIRPDDH